MIGIVETHDVADPAGKRNLVTVAGALPYPQVPHAGGRYLLALSRQLKAAFKVTYIVPNSSPNLEAAHSSEIAALFAGLEAPGHSYQSIISFVIARIEAILRRLHPGIASLSVGWYIITNAKARLAIQSADIVDLQWAEFVGLARLIKRLNPHARIIGTYHDVLSQLYLRRAKRATGLRRLRWKLAAKFSIASETRSVRFTETVVTLNSKDAALLRRRGVTATVIDPPLAVGIRPRTPQATPIVLFVGYFARDINCEAVEWFLKRVWPGLRGAFPECQLRLVGADPQGKLAAVVRGAVGVKAIGYVENIWDEYANADVCVVPLLSGSGVKFKAIEPLLAGVPTVSTTIGVEGIETGGRFARVVDDARGFREAIFDIIVNPAEAEQRAHTVQAEVRAQYSISRFQAMVDEVYRTHGSDASREGKS